MTASPARAWLRAWPRTWLGAWPRAWPRTWPRTWFVPLVPLYRLALTARELGLRSGLQPVRHLAWPVVSIGNLSTGGAGKTPLTIALAQALTRRGVHVDVLSRGYGRHSRAAARVDPNGSAEEYGDEPLEIARAAGVPVYVAAQRYEAGVLAERDAEEFFGTRDAGVGMKGTGVSENDAGVREGDAGVGEEGAGISMTGAGFSMKGTGFSPYVISQPPSWGL